MVRRNALALNTQGSPEEICFLMLFPERAHFVVLSQPDGRA